jgi:hypothetical protein
MGLVCCLFHAAFLFGLIFNPEYGSEMIFRNVSFLSTDHMMLSQMIILFKNLYLLIDYVQEQIKIVLMAHEQI